MCFFFVADKDEESESSDSEERKIQRRLSKQETPALLLTHMALAAGDTYFADKTKQQRSIGNALSAHWLTPEWSAIRFHFEVVVDFPSWSIGRSYRIDYRL